MTVHHLFHHVEPGRQVLAELLDPLTPIILGSKDYYEVTNMQELLPRAFTGESL